MTATWTVLGAGTAVPRAGYGCSGHALRPAPGAKVTLFDCGPGTIRSLPAAGIELEEVHRVVLSHYHVDHCLDVFALFFARRNPRYRPPFELELIGPPGLGRLLARGARTLGRQAAERDARVVELDLDGAGRAGVDRGDMRLTCVANGHTDTSVSWRADLPGGRAVAYTGDTPPSEAVADLARGVDLFTIECALPDELGVSSHLTPASAAAMAVASRCRRVLLTHFYPELDPAAAGVRVAESFEGPVELARDGLVLEV